MPKWLILVLVLVGVCCLGGIGGGFFLFRGASNQTEGAMKFADKAVPEITKTWDVDAFMRNADPSIATGTAKAETEAAVKNMANLFGPMKSLEPWRFVGINAKTNNTEGSYVDIELAGAGEFEKHPAKSIELSLRKRGDGEWKILGLFLHEKAK